MYQTGCVDTNVYWYRRRVVNRAWPERQWSWYVRFVRRWHCPRSWVDRRKCSRGLIMECYWCNFAGVLLRVDKLAQDLSAYTATLHFRGHAGRRSSCWGNNYVRTTSVYGVVRIHGNVSIQGNGDSSCTVTGRSCTLDTERQRLCEDSAPPL